MPGMIPRPTFNLGVWPKREGKCPAGPQPGVDWVPQPNVTVWSQAVGLGSGWVSWSSHGANGGTTPGWKWNTSCHAQRPERPLDNTQKKACVKRLPWVGWIRRERTDWQSCDHQAWLTQEKARTQRQAEARLRCDPEAREGGSCLHSGQKKGWAWLVPCTCLCHQRRTCRAHYSDFEQRCYRKESICFACFYF